ncbi:hypothetical protein ACP70R_021152 [Stipagrostis hirtigluma subsp. patula]
MPDTAARARGGGGEPAHAGATATAGGSRGSGRGEGAPRSRSGSGLLAERRACGVAGSAAPAGGRLDGIHRREDSGDRRLGLRTRPTRGRRRGRLSWVLARLPRRSDSGGRLIGARASTTSGRRRGALNRRWVHAGVFSTRGRS